MLHGSAWAQQHGHRYGLEQRQQYVGSASVTPETRVLDSSAWLRRAASAQARCPTAAAPAAAPSDTTTGRATSTAGIATPAAGP